MALTDLPTHGGLPLTELAQLGIDPREVLDLSTSLSPFPAHPEVLRAVRECALDRYPDPHCIEAKRAIARATGHDADGVVIGHGSVELLWSLVQVLGAVERPLLMVSPTFSEAEDAARAQRLRVAHVYLAEDDDFAPDARAIDAAIVAERPFAVYLCQPNNPTGGALPHARLAALIASHPKLPFIVDEAFLSLSHLHANAREPLPSNAVRVRSLTKDHCLPGLRLGYALCQPALARRLEARRPPWMVSSPAQAAIVAALAQPEHVRAMREALLRLKDDLERALRARRFGVLPSEASFFLMRVPHGESADLLRARLLREHKILVRSGRSFGLPEYIRLPACTPEARARLLAALGR
jgi:histidinol-phosphate/aromatic aminotransferase/cobyric acid decarboxylase-like protein